MFDYDDFDINIKKTINLKKFSEIEKIISTRCFEVWYLLHFKYTTKYFNKTSEIEKKIEKYLSDSKYKKNVSYFEEILSKQETAVNNAKRLKKYHKDQGIEINTKEANPQTEVYRLVEYLNNLTK